MRKITVFYAWQSDTPEDFNRHLIGIALTEAAKRISEDEAFDAKVHIDSDTAGVPGTPPVSETILAKIASCDIFVPDMTFVARTEAGKLIPNPNVMTEYGYALRAKTYAAMMPVMNTVFGPPTALPFDMGHLRHPIQYSADPVAKDAERRATRKALSARLEEMLRLQIAAMPPPSLPVRLPFARAEAKDGPARFRRSGEPLGKRWSEMRLPGVGSENSILLATGPAIWLRLMPQFQHGTRWPTYELRQHAMQPNSLNLAPLIWSNIYFIRAEDGFGICTLASPDAPETVSVAFAFETGEVWAADTYFLACEPKMLFIGEIEKVCSERLQDYAHFLGGLGLRPPYHWAAGITGVRGHQLQIPLRPGHLRIPGWSGPECLSDSVTDQGTYDGKQTPLSALVPFFKAIYDRCGVPRPDYLPI